MAILEPQATSIPSDTLTDCQDRERLRNDKRFDVTGISASGSNLALMPEKHPTR